MNKEELDQILLDNRIIFINEYKDRYMYRSSVHSGDNWNYNRYLVSKDFTKVYHGLLSEFGADDDYKLVSDFNEVPNDILISIINHSYTNVFKFLSFCIAESSSKEERKAHERAMKNTVNEFTKFYF